ncbi:cysteine desulfurase family protein [Larkinella humicola]|uniref:cysteine desulfurase n=1 Tax=Larkinella humicola TaxID=2607654 RepID=A0A5N1JAS7_9BACT|nr:cysteine desulfurase family protein [Larkinella humicola]KAA9349591.1 cysteine desulfurase [Larkinella humicola]
MEVYFDNAATTALDPEVLEAMLPYLTQHYGNPSSAHHKGRETRRAIETARRTVADLLNAQPDEIIFTSGATESDNMALVGSIRGLGIRHAVSSPIEHKAVVQTLHHLEKDCYVQTHWLHLDAQGRLDWADLELYLRQYPRALVSLMHGNNEIGTLNDLERIGWLSRYYQAVFHSDTVQTMGQYGYDLAQLPVDFLVGSAHKFHGPKGVGFLFARRAYRVPALLHGGSQERGWRPGTENVAGIVGLAKALEISCRNRKAIHKHSLGLKNRLIEKLLNALPGVVFNGTSGLPDESLATVVNVGLPAVAEKSLVELLDEAGIAVSGGSACTAGAGSHVLEALGTPTNRENIRISLGKYNSDAEVDFLISVLKEIYAPIPEQEPV